MTLVRGAIRIDLVGLSRNLPFSSTFRVTNQRTRGGVLEDILGLEDVLEDTFSSPWPRSLKYSKIALSSARGQHYFLNG